MLIQFSFSNYRSFREETILDMTATKITEHSDRIVAQGGEKLLRTAAIYGANASGKSTVIDALRFMKKYVVNSFMFGGETDEDDGHRYSLQRTPYLFDDYSRDEVTGFEVFFTLPEDKRQKIYNYGFTIDNEKVTEEWLNTKAKTSENYKKVFYRDTEGIELFAKSKTMEDNLRVSLEKEVLAISLGAKLKVDIFKAVRDWFASIVFVDFGDPLENAILARRVPPQFADDDKVQEDVVNYFASFDPAIVGFDIEKKKDEEGNNRLLIEALHKKEGGGKVGIPLRDESAGTLKMFALYPALKKILESGGVLCVDELNARLHPLLVRNFLISFLDPEINKNNAQIIFTTHDAWQLANNTLRRDEIWFTEKEKEGTTELYSLVDIVDEMGDKIRKDENYEKNYLLGKYGAIPELRNIGI